MAGMANLAYPNHDMETSLRSRYRGKRQLRLFHRAVVDVVAAVAGVAAAAAAAAAADSWSKSALKTAETYSTLLGGR